MDFITLYAIATTVFLGSGVCCWIIDITEHKHTLRKRALEWSARSREWDAERKLADKKIYELTREVDITNATLNAASDTIGQLKKFIEMKKKNPRLSWDKVEKMFRDAAWDRVEKTFKDAA